MCVCVRVRVGDAQDLIDVSEAMEADDEDIDEIASLMADAMARAHSRNLRMTKSRAHLV